MSEDRRNREAHRAARQQAYEDAALYHQVRGEPHATGSRAAEHGVNPVSVEPIRMVEEGNRRATRAAMADEIERWMRSDRIALMYGPEILRGDDITREAAEDLAAILSQRFRHA